MIVVIAAVVGTSEKQDELVMRSGDKMRVFFFSFSPGWVWGSVAATDTATSRVGSGGEVRADTVDTMGVRGRSGLGERCVLLVNTASGALAPPLRVLTRLAAMPMASSGATLRKLSLAV